jgi:hypothetical protein
LPGRARASTWLALLFGLLALSAIGAGEMGSPASRPLPGGPTKSATRSGATALRLEALPLRAQSVISSTLGSARGAFDAQRIAAGYLLKGGGLNLDLGKAGIFLPTTGGALSMRLSGIGRDGFMGAIGPTRPTAQRNRVTYARAGAKEWYVAGPLGVEQGFTISRRPAGGAGELALALTLGGSLQPKLAGSQVLFDTPSGHLALRYGALSAVDARGRQLPAVFALRGRTLLLRVDDRGARYPLRIDPFIQQGSKLIGAGGIAKSEFGTGVALSANGSTALVGGSQDNAGKGAAWVFTRSGETWTQQGEKLVGDCTSTCGGPNGTGEEEGGEFGASVALSADGNTALIGGLGDHELRGAAWVFARAGGAWSQQGAKLTGGGESGQGRMGESVALSANGDTALVGGDGDGGGAGAAWVFTRSGETWAAQGPKLTGPAGSFGESVALSSDGNTALIGSPLSAGQRGAAAVFTRSGVTWTQQGADVVGDCESACGGPNGTGEEGAGHFGFSVRLSSDGNTALIGGGLDNAEKGAAWVFTRSGEAWSQQGPKLTGTGESGAGEFGSAVALSGDGNTALVGAFNDRAAQGSAWVFARSGGVWTQQGEKLTGSGEGGAGWFGESVALSSDGSTALFGGPLDSAEKGAAWIFANPVSAVPPALVPVSPPPVTKTPPPVLTNVTESHTAWRVGHKLAQLSRHKKRRPPIGTVFSFTLNEPATVHFSFAAMRAGHRVGHACAAKARRHAPGKVCQRLLPVGTLTFSAHAGTDHVSFQGRIPGSKPLAPGSYSVSITAKNGSGEAPSPRSLSFSIVR